jgi:C-terminal processing protease CtpA/Prc
VIKHSAGSVAGYYLNDTGFTDIAVLQIKEFESSVDDSTEYEREFQTVVEKFLAASVKTGKRKLIIDLQGNGGKSLGQPSDFIATDLYRRLR